MAGAKETPRQKMIGMMYLVLTALLALNVSKSILESFVRVNESLQTTNRNFKTKNADLFNDISNTAINNPEREKVQRVHERAKKVQDSADKVFGHIDSMKAFLLKEVEGLPSLDSAANFPLAKASGKSNYDVPTNRLGVATPKNPKDGKYSAKRLKKMINSYRSFLFDTYEEFDLLGEGKDTNDLKLNLETKGDSTMDAPSAATWEGLHFYHAPLAATITALSKIQNDIQNAESETYNALLTKIGKKKFNIDTTATKVVPLNGSYIAVGDTYRAEVVVAAWSKSQEPVVEVGQEVDDSTGELTGSPDSGSISIEHGMGIYQFAPDKPGQYTWGGRIGIKKPDGTIGWNRVPLQTVRAAEQNVVVSPTKMNVLYRGLNNPVSVSVPGLAAEDLQASMSNGSLSQRGAGQYMARPGKASNKAVVTVSDKDGRRLGDMDFRVKDVPRPEPYFAGKTTTDNVVSLNRLKVSGEVTAELKDFLFEGVQYKVIEFQIGATVGGQFPTQEQRGSNKLSARQKELLNNAERGGRVEVRNIVALDPSGKRRNLSSLSFEVR